MVAALGALASVGSGAAVAASGGGIGAPESPKVIDVTCQTKCAGLRQATVGSTVQFRGRNLEYVTKVRFNDEGGGRVSTEPENASPRRLEAVVPERATSGKPQVVGATGEVATSPEALAIVSESDVTSERGVGVGEVAASPSKGFFAGKRQAAASFVAQGSGPQDIRVDVVGGDGTVVRSIVKQEVEPQTPERVRWNGKTDTKEVAPNGDYSFDVKPLSGGAGSQATFEQYDHIFPLRGKHSYGDGLGAGRGHQGQDVFAKCGARIVAARGGRVKHKAYHSRAGNYVVIDGKKTKVDYAYMHLQSATELDNGDRVKTGQTIGRNGATGNASGCHLHFEMWEGGWYSGGSVINPTPHMKRWDGWS